MMTENEARSLLVSMAVKYIGYSEASGKHKQIVDIYNARTPLPRNYRVTYADAWCATYVSAMAILCGMANIIPRECSCYFQVEQWIKMERWCEDDNHVPSAGDIIYYDWQDSGNGDNKGVPDHVGIVETVAHGVITVIEGNKNDSVERRFINIGAKNIRGYGLPNFKWWAEQNTPKKKDPWYVTDGTWQEGTRLGIVDGNRPTAQATRAEVNKMILTAMRLMKEGK